MPTSQTSFLPASPLQTLLDTIRSQSRNETEKGTAFETLCIRYLQNKPEYQHLYRTVQPYKEWAAQHGAPLGLTPGDKGIDLVATTHSGEHHAVQCKCYASDHIVAKPDIDSFLSASGHKAFFARILIDTTRKAYGTNAEETLQHQSIPVLRIDLLKLENSRIDWAQYRISQPEAPLFDGIPAYSDTPDAIALKPRHLPHDYQQKAIDAVLQGLQTADRGKLIMACGTGKTFTALKIAEAQAGAGKTILFLVPSLALLSQTLTEWSQHSQIPLTAFAVCSDSEVGKQKTQNNDDDTIPMALHELAYPATTHAAHLAEEYQARHKPTAMTVVFSTYHSIDVIHQAQTKHHLPAFDLAICDEAHRTTGVQFDGDDESAFVRIHDNSVIQATKRLYMTATPRIYSADETKKKRSAQQTGNLLASTASHAAQTLQDLGSNTVYSMDDERLYGKTLHTLGFSEAVRLGRLAPYKVVVLTVDEKDVGERLQKLFNDGNNNLQVGDAARIVGCYKALAKVGHDWDSEGQDRAPMQRAVAFCQIIGQDRKGDPIHPGTKIAARHIAEQFNLVTRAYQENAKSDEAVLGIEFEARYIHGGMQASAKSELLNWLKAPTERNHCRVLTNVRCLSEGVDVPALDAAIFLSPRQSQVDIVQSVGRVMRLAPGKTRGYIILPVVIPWGMTEHEAMQDNKPWQVVWKTLAALKAHDDEGFGRLIDRFELAGGDPEHFQISIDQASIRRARQKTEEEQKQDALAQARIGHHIGNATESPAETQPQQTEMEWTTGALEQAILAKIVKKMADPDYWDRWSRDIARIAQMHIDRITAIVQDPAHTHARTAFEQFATQLRKHLNPAVLDADIIEMIVQHLITGPVFDALFDGSHFSQKNPISTDLQAIADILLKDFHLGKEHQQLQGFYEQVRLQCADIPSPAARQRLIIRLYDNFFASAFPRVVQKHGIVYTPIEIVDFILHSVAHVLQIQFGKTLADEDVQILDPFTGTGTFIARLLASNLIEKEKLPQVYTQKLHANEILLLPYYIAAVNIESTFAGRFPERPYTPFPGILLADTFNIPTTTSQDWVEKQAQEVLAANNARRKRQMDSKITVIVGNPPYSVGQKSQNDNNQNVAYSELDKRIKNTYAEKSSATLKQALYDSYIRAIRWASDRIDPQQGGIIGFVTNAGWLDSAATAGLRQCLRQEFSSLYIFHLRGNARTQGEQRRKEAGNVFDAGSRAPVAISILVKQPGHNGHGEIHFCDIGDYLSRQQKLAKIEILQSIGRMETAGVWQNITPDEHGDWLNQRQGDFAALLPMGDTKNKSKADNSGMFENFSNGVKTNRDPWCNNPSRTTMLDNIQRLVDFYEQQRAAFARAFPDVKQRQTQVTGFIDTNPEKISWTRELLADVIRNKPLAFNSNAAVPTLYRPFNKGWLYYSRMLNNCVYQMPQIFPLPATEQNRTEQNRTEQNRTEQIIPSDSQELFQNPQKNHNATCTQENRLICVSGVGSRSFSVLMVDQVPDLHVLESGTQCFPRYLYDETGQQKDGVTDATLKTFQTHYSEKSITKDQIFDHIYGILHSPDYRATYAHNLTKELPRIPFTATWEDFCAFAEAGKQLGDLHCHFETVTMFEGVDITIHKKGCTTLQELQPVDFHVEKMKFGKAKNGKDTTTIIYNPYITLRNIPEKAYAYIVNGKSAIDWVMERQCVKTDKASGIVSDANRYAVETLGNPRYPLELLLRVITVSLETLKTVQTLPPYAASQQ